MVSVSVFTVHLLYGWFGRSMGGFGAVSWWAESENPLVDCGHQLPDFGETSGATPAFVFFHSPEKKQFSTFIL